MSLTENSDQVFLPGGCNRTQNLRFGPYTNYDETERMSHDSQIVRAKENLKLSNDGPSLFIYLFETSNAEQDVDPIVFAI